MNSFFLLLPPKCFNGRFRTPHIVHWTITPNVTLPSQTRDLSATVRVLRNLIRWSQCQLSDSAIAATENSLDAASASSSSCFPLPVVIGLHGPACQDPCFLRPCLRTRELDTQQRDIAHVQSHPNYTPAVVSHLACLQLTKKEKCAHFVCYISHGPLSSSHVRRACAHDLLCGYGTACHLEVEFLLCLAFPSTKNNFWVFSLWP